MLIIPALVVVMCVIVYLFYIIFTSSLWVGVGLLGIVSWYVFFIYLSNKYEDEESHCCLPPPPYEGSFGEFIHDEESCGPECRPHRIWHV